MENASKALIMAAAILLAIMLISLSVFLFTRFKGTAENSINMDEAEINAFNSKLTPYFGEAVQGSKVNSLLQLCLSINMAAYSAGGTQYKNVSVIYPGGKLIGDNSSTYSKKYDRVPTGNTYYKVEATNYRSGLICEITVTPNP